MNWHELQQEHARLVHPDGEPCPDGCDQKPVSNKGRAMTKREFIKRHREEIDRHIRMMAPGVSINDFEREQWLLTDERLYRLALAHGVILP